MEIVDTIFGINTTPMKLQKQLHCGEVFSLWQHLIRRYDILELTDIFQNFAHDAEFKAILSLGLRVLNEETSQLEEQMNKFGIPLPPRPPKSINSPTNTEILRDELMFRIIYTGIQNFVVQQVNTLISIQFPSLRDIFLKMEKKELDIFIKMSDYGKLKGWVQIPPSYNVGQ